MNHVSKEQEEIREKRENARIAREHKVELKRIAMVGYVVPTEDDKEAEKALRKIATKGGMVCIYNLQFAIYNSLM